MARSKDAQVAAYAFLRKHAQEETEFTFEELAGATGWKVGAVKTYIGKQFKFKV